MRNKVKLNRKQRIELIGIFTGITLSTFILSMIVVSFAAYFIVRTGTFHIVDKDLPGAGRLIILIALMSVIVNLIFIFFVEKITMKPVKRLITGMGQLSSGDYTARMTVGKPFGHLSVMREVSECFNTMAEELQNTETLRSDFINNFSHEFKTPIVSIAGFAKLLKNSTLSDEEKNEYIDIIEEESMRLSYMATNVLNLTKVENQNILTDISVFNLSEQIRSCVLLLEKKWEKKNLELYMDFDEYMICANEDTLKHIWINLIDNAIKFSADYGILEIDIKQDPTYLYVSITNNGEVIPPEAQDKIWRKFYQGDESHAADGNGIGLAVVKRVVDLHNGTVNVQSENNSTTFTVKLPKNQE